MRMLPAALTVLSLLAVGCTADPHSLSRVRGRTAAADETRPTAESEAVTVNGAVSDLDGAATVDVNAMGEDGKLTPIGTAMVENGKFTTNLPPGASPTGIFIVKVKDVAGAVLGAGVINGIPAFVQGITIDAAVDVVTTFKAEIITTIAQKNVPGVQSYLNVVDAFVNQELAAIVQLEGVGATDINNIIGAVSDAVIAAQDVMVDALGKAGIDVDLDALQRAQITAVSGLQGLVTSASGQLISTSKNLVAGLQAASARAVAPIDTAIFNAIVNGGAAFSGTVERKTRSYDDRGRLAFAASRSSFSLTTAMSTERIAKDDPRETIAKACADFTAAVRSATKLEELEAAKTAITNVLLGKESGGFQGLLERLRSDLVGALRSLDMGRIADALAKLDASDLPLAVRLVQKQVVQ